jgi:hypothetical protein
VKGDEGKAPITPTLDAVEIFSGETGIRNGTGVLTEQAQNVLKSM